MIQVSSWNIVLLWEKEWIRYNKNGYEISTRSYDSKHGGGREWRIDVRDGQEVKISSLSGGLDEGLKLVEIGKYKFSIFQFSRDRMRVAHSLNGEEASGIFWEEVCIMWLNFYVLSLICLWNIKRSLQIAFTSLVLSEKLSRVNICEGLLVAGVKVYVPSHDKCLFCYYKGIKYSL